MFSLPHEETKMLIGKPHQGVVGLRRVSLCVFFLSHEFVRRTFDLGGNGHIYCVHISNIEQREYGCGVSTLVDLVRLYRIGFFVFLV